MFYCKSVPKPPRAPVGAQTGVRTLDVTTSCSIPPARVVCDFYKCFIASRLLNPPALVSAQAGLDTGYLFCMCFSASRLPNMPVLGFGCRIPLFHLFYCTSAPKAARASRRAGRFGYLFQFLPPRKAGLDANPQFEKPVRSLVGAQAGLLQFHNTQPDTRASDLPAQTFLRHNSMQTCLRAGGPAGRFGYRFQVLQAFYCKSAPKPAHAPVGV